jgi:UDP:flavonoid glycosyltransferase YjiC (YdhE family)
MKVLVLPFPLLAHYVRCLELLGDDDALEVVVAGGAPCASYATTRGRALTEVDNFDAEIVLAHTERFDFGWLSSSEIARVFHGFVRAIERERPDVVVSDAAQVARMAAEYTKVPHVALANAYMTPFYRGTRGIPERHYAKKHERRLPAWMFEPISRVAEYFSMRTVHAPFRELRARLGLPDRRTYLEEYGGDRVAILDAPEVFPLAPLPRDFEVLGPVFRGDAQALAPLPQKGAIVVSFGSSGDWEQLELLNDPVFDDVPILALGKVGARLTGQNVERLAFAEPEDILPRARAVLCHGGNGTLYQALAYGVPVLCRPRMFEQEWNVRQFEDRGLCARIPMHTDALTLRAQLDAMARPEHVGSIGFLPRTQQRARMRAMLEAVRASARY